jgi:hypothetical protein
MPTIHRFLQAGSPAVAVVPEQHFEPSAADAIPYDRALQIQDRQPHRRVVVFRAPCDPAIYGEGKADFYLRCMVCGWWSLPFVEPPPIKELRCRACAERLAGEMSFAGMVASARWGLYVSSVVEGQPQLHQPETGVAFGELLTEKR